jgi:hypothetical protein
MNFSCHLYTAALGRGLRTKTGNVKWKINFYSCCIQMVITAIIFKSTCTSQVKRMNILTCAIFGDEWERFNALVLDGMSPPLSWV